MSPLLLNATVMLPETLRKFFKIASRCRITSLSLGVDELSEKDKLTVARDCKVKQFVPHPFFVAEMFTGTPEKSGLENYLL